jgi:tetratricopeptide (TPR) repeat protein
MVLVLTLSSIWAAGSPPQWGPSTDESHLIERVRSESDPDRRVPLLIQFIDRFPESASAHWAYQRLQSAYLDQGAWAQALEVGQRLMNIYPADIDGAVNCLRAAQALQIVELVRRYAIESWKRASWLALTPAVEAQSARAVMSNAEFALATLARDADPQTRASARQSLARLNPRSTFGPDGAAAAGGTAARWGAESQESDPEVPDDVPPLIAAADFDLERGLHLAGVLEKSQRVLRLVGDGAGPLPDRYRTAARWMAGVAASFLGRYALADEHLRAALPGLSNSPGALATALYHLGFANYWLAEMGERNRIFDALRFNQQCAAMRGPYQEMAAKTVASIKSQYNMR